MQEKLIYGIQQIGVGVRDAAAGFKWYGTVLKADIQVFDDNNEATFMAKYMGGKPRQKRAILAMNLNGGSGYEIWQHTEHVPQPPINPVQIGDLGINIMKIKSNDIQQSYNRLKAEKVNILTDIIDNPDGSKAFFIKDPFDNILEIKEFNSWFKKKNDIGGICGATLGVSNIEATLKLFVDVLGYDKVLDDSTGVFESLKVVPGGNETMRRILLGHSERRIGGFTPLLGESQIELVEVKSRMPNKIFEGRYWGDLGYIHLCFDIHNMNQLVKECEAAGFPFSVLSNPDFDMGEANGHWGYLEDPDGTLIEFVETHKVPLIPAIGWSINLTKRDPKKNLPNWLMNAMALNRAKF
jgi:catechol 2,3-dioxygenase-like lactoylglutathione lyase family enzyme